MFRMRGPVVVGVVALLLLGCTGEVDDVGVAEEGDAGAEVDGAAAGDRQPANANPRQRTVEDVTAMLLPVGGPTIRRGARAANVMANAQAKNCGGIIIDIEDTSSRLDQGLLADLELIVGHTYELLGVEEKILLHTIAGDESKSTFRERFDSSGHSFTSWLLFERNPTTFPLALIAMGIVA